MEIFVFRSTLHELYNTEYSSLQNSACMYMFFFSNSFTKTSVPFMRKVFDAISSDLPAKHWAQCTTYKDKTLHFLHCESLGAIRVSL